MDPTPTEYPTETPTETATDTAWIEPSATETPSDTPTLEPTPTETYYETPSETPTETATETPTETITETPTETETPTPSPTQCGNNAKDEGEECDTSAGYGDNYCKQIKENSSAICGSDCNCAVDRCGNKQLDDGEECDDGSSQYGTNYCKKIKENSRAYCEDCECRIDPCGNAQLDNGEECDGSSSNYGDSYCQKIKERSDVMCKACECTDTCGNGARDSGEECDDGNQVDGDGCSSLCKKECGNGVIDPNEECDDGNSENKDGCDTNCKIQVCCICEWQDNGYLACDNDRFQKSCDRFVKSSKCEKATVIVNPVTAEVGGIPMENPEQWCVKNPARQAYSQCEDKLVHYEYNGHGDRDTAQYCVNAIKEACTATGGLPPKYMSCVFNSCNTVDDQAGLESFLQQVQSQYPWINWSIQGYPQAYFTDDSGNSSSDICQPHLKYTINADGLNMSGVPCSEVIGKSASQSACEEIETTVCIDDVSDACPVGSTLPTKTLYSCPTNPSQHNGALIGDEGLIVDAIWQEDKCPMIECHSKCFRPPYQATGCLDVVGAGENQCYGESDC